MTWTSTAITSTELRNVCPRMTAVPPPTSAIASSSGHARNRRSDSAACPEAKRAIGAPWSGAMEPIIGPIADRGNGRQGLIQHEHVERPVGREQYVLLAVEHEGLGRTLQTPDLRIPEALARRRVPRFGVLAVAHEQDAAGRREQAGAPAVDLLAPDHLAGLVVDGDDVRRERDAAAAAAAAEAHRATRLRLH